MGCSFIVTMMNSRSSKLFSLALTGAAGLAFVPSVHASTILSGTSAGNNTNIAATYGSNLAGTPNIALTWSPVNPSGSASYNGWQAYSGWTNLSATNTTGTGVYQMGEASTGVNYDILFTPTVTDAVALNSIDFNRYTGNGNTFTVSLNVMDSTGTTSLLGTPISHITSNDGNSTQSIGYTGAIGQALLLRLNIANQGQSGAYLAMDNLTFAQVPEPSTALLAAGGLGALALRRRRK